MEADERVARRRDEGSQSGQKLGRVHDAMGLPAARVLDAIGDATIAQDREALEAERSPRAVAQEPLAAFTVVRRNRNGGVDIEASR